MTNEQKPASTDPSIEQFEFNSYDLLTPTQQTAANLLTEAVYAKSTEDYVHYAGQVSRKFTGRTDSSSYIGEEGEYQVVDYVAEKVFKDFVAGIAQGDSSGASALKHLGIAFKRYERLARYPGHDLSSDENLARVFFQMRTFYREATHIAIAIDDKEALAKWNERWKKFNYNNSLEERLEDYDKDAQAREETYARFRLDHKDNEIWSNVIHHATSEERRGEDHPYLLKEIRVQDLAALAAEIRELPEAERLGRLTENSPTGNPWTHELPGLSTRSSASFAMNIQRLQKVLENVERPREAVILGAWDTFLIDRLVGGKKEVKGGTISDDPIAEHVFVVDPDTRSSENAKKMFEGSEVTITESDVTDLPFGNNSQELIVGNQTRQSMDASCLKNFYMELSRVLKQGGMYIDQAQDRGISKATYNRWKVLLSQMIVDIAMPQASGNPIEREQERAVLAGLGLEEHQFRYSGDPIKVLIKKASIKSIGYHAIEGRGVEHMFTLDINKVDSEGK